MQCGACTPPAESNAIDTTDGHINGNVSGQMSFKAPYVIYEVNTDTGKKFYNESGGYQFVCFRGSKQNLTLWIYPDRDSDDRYCAGCHWDSGNGDGFGSVYGIVPPNGAYLLDRDVSSAKTGGRTVWNLCL